MSDRNVLLIYTGGTIGMMQDLESGDLKPLDFNQLSIHIPELKRLDIIIDTYTFEPIDSSNLKPGLWVDIAKLIKSKYNDYDGFVILHGTDTIAYTASALSFMLENLSKPVILTGSQLPIGVLRTDGKENIITSIQIAADKDYAGNPVIQEVAIYFEYKLFRGNRSIKYSANHFDAIKSPNYLPLAEAGINIEYNNNLLWKTNSTDNLSVSTSLSNQISVLHLYPGIDLDVLKYQFENLNIKGLILRTYGSGNAPTDMKFLIFLKKLIDSGILILNVTQCLQGSVVLGKYETSRYLKDMGVLSAADMTFESAITKLMYLLGKENNNETVKKLLTKNLKGEMSKV